MNPEKQRIAIAKACGWKNIIFRGLISPVENDYAGKIRDGWQDTLPDYLHDLNAIHDAIMSVIVRGPDLIEFRSNEDLFEEQLDALCAREQVPCWHFSAELYAEAFLKTLGKWEDA